MADREFNVLISAETDDFSSGIREAEREASGLGNTLSRETATGAEDASSSLRETTEELRRLQREALGTVGSIDNLEGGLDGVSDSANIAGDSFNELGSDARSTSSDISDLRDELRGVQRDALGANASINGIGNSFGNTSSESRKFNREMQRLSMILGGDVPESTQQAYKEMYRLNQEARRAKRVYGTYSQEALNARDAVTNFALGLDDAAFKQIYMRSQLGLTDMQLRQQANSIKLNARMTSLMGNQTQILTQRMQGLAKHGIKPEMLLPPSTIGQFQLLNETVGASGRGVYALSSAYRKLGGSVEKVIKNYSAQKVAIREAQGDMVRYGLLLRGITAANANMALAFPIVGMAAYFAYKTMFSAALEANEALKELAETTKGKVLKALDPVIQAAGKFLEVALNVIGVVADWITKFNEAHPIIAKVAGAIGFLLPAMTLLLLPLQMGVGLWNGWMIAINGVWTMFGGVVTMIGTASSTFLAFAGIIGGVVVAFMYLWKTNEGFRDACIGIWEAIKSTINTALESIKQWFISHSETIKSVLQTGYEALKTVIKTVMDAIGEIVNLILNNIRQFWLEHGTTVMQAVMKIYETIETIIKSCLDTIKSIVKTVLDAVKEFWQTHGDSIKNIAKIAWDLIKSLIQSALNIIKSVINAVCSAINGDWDTFWSEVGNIAKSAGEAIKNIVKAFMQALPGIIKSVMGLVSSAFKAVLDAGANVCNGFISTMANIGKNIIQGLANGIKSGLSIVTNAITGVVKGAINAGKKLLGINSPSKLFMQFGEWTTEGYQIGVDRGEPSSTRSVENFAQNSVNAFENNFSNGNVINESALSSSNYSESNTDFNKMYDVMTNAFVKAIETTGINKQDISIDGKKVFEAISPRMGKAVRGW